MYRFLVCELKTGDVLVEAPFETEGDLSRVLQAFGAGTLILPIRARGCPANWRELILPGRVLLVAVNGAEDIVWAGIPRRRRRRGSGRVAFPSVTLEAYLLDRYVPTRSFRGVDQTLIARDLAAVAGDAAGIPLQYDCPPSGVLRDRDYADSEDARVYSRLQELAAVGDGFNWTIDVTWADDTHKRVAYTFRTGYPYLGNRSATPNRVLELPGNITDYEQEDSWDDGEAATYVEATGDGDTDTRIRSTPRIDTVREAAGWPRVEYRGHFSGVKQTATIEGHAQALATQMFGGQNVITLTLRSPASPGAADLTRALGETARVQITDEELTMDEVLVIVGWDLASNSTKRIRLTLARLEGAK